MWVRDANGIMIKGRVTIVAVISLILVVGIVVLVIVLTNKDDDNGNNEDGDDGGDDDDDDDGGDGDDDIDVEFVTRERSNKGLCIDDRSSLDVTPPHLPQSWPNTTVPLTTVRTFSYSEGGHRDWTNWLILSGYHVLVGIATDSDDDYLALSQFYQRHKTEFTQCVMAIAVGNEPETTEVDAIVNSINVLRSMMTAQSLPTVPLTSVINMNSATPQEWIVPGSSWPPNKGEFSVFYKTLLPHIDIVCFNAYGGFFDMNGLSADIGFDTALAASLSWTPGESVLLNQMTVLRFAMSEGGVSDKELWCTETGWSSSPLVYTSGKPVTDDDGNVQTNDEWSNIANWNTFYDGFTEFDTTVPMNFNIDGYDYQNVMPPERVFLFALRDSTLRQLEIREYFGLFTDDVNQLVTK
jgi:hypothetical protein